MSYEHHIDPFYPTQAGNWLQAHPRTVREATTTEKPFIQSLNDTIRPYQYTKSHSAAMQARPREPVLESWPHTGRRMTVFSYGARLALHITDLTIQDLHLASKDTWDTQLAQYIHHHGSQPGIRDDMPKELHEAYSDIIAETVHADRQICRTASHVGHFLDGYATVMQPARLYIGRCLADTALAIHDSPELIALEFDAE